MEQGAELMVPVLIRDKSPVRRVYASCCDTPLFDIGGVSCLINTDLLDQDSRPEVRFRIIGRDSQKAVDDQPKPAMSWSLPLAWLWTMPGRVQKDKMEPSPIDISKPKILENFKEG